jgi:hypothetical protein
MATKNHRQGGKFGGNHTTFIDAAIILANIAAVREEVSCVSPGFISSGKGGGNGQRRVKISDAPWGLLLTVSQNASVQEVKVFTGNLHATKFGIACGARNADIAICFGRVQS